MVQRVGGETVAIVFAQSIACAHPQEAFGIFMNGQYCVVGQAVLYGELFEMDVLLGHGTDLCKAQQQSYGDYEICLVHGISLFSAAKLQNVRDKCTKEFE